MSAAALRAERLREKKKLDEKVPVVDISSDDSTSLFTTVRKWKIIGSVQLYEKDRYS